MKSKLLLSLFLGASLIASADGYKDGIEYFKADQFDNARDILQRNLNNKGTDKAISYYYLGAIDLKKGDKAAAKANFDNGVKQNPKCAFNYVGLGQLDLMNGDEKSAEENFKKAKSFDKKNHEVTVLIARAYYNADPVKYAKEIDKYLKKAHKDSKDNEPSIYILEGDMLIDQKKVGEAAGKYENAIYYQDDNSEGYVKYANAYFSVRPDYAIQKLEELNSKLPNSALAQRELAEKYYANGQWLKASDTYGKYIQNPNHFPEDRARYSVLLYYGESYQNSLEIAESYLANDANDFLMNRMKMLNLAALKRYPEAKAAAEKFFTLKGYFTGNDYITYADILLALGEAESGLTIVEKGVKELPDNTALLGKLSKVYYEAKRLSESVAVYDRLIEAKAKHGEKLGVPDYYEAGGRYLMYLSTLDSASMDASATAKGVAYIDKALELQPTNPSLVRRKAQLYFFGNNKVVNEPAAKEFVRLIELLDKDPEQKNPSNPNNSIDYYKNACLMLGLYYDGLNDVANTIKYFSRYLEFDPSNADIRDYVDRLKKKAEEKS